MNNIKKHLKAFTLIELMAVVIILGIVTTITVTSINYTVKQSKQRLYLQQIERMEAGVRTWAVDNTELLPDDEFGIAFFDVSRLKDEGIIDAELVIDPRDDSELSGCMVIRYNSAYNQYEYNYEDKPCSEVEGTYLPTITIKNGSNQFLEICSTYEFPEATAVTYAGNTIEAVGPIIKKNGTIVTNISSVTLGDIYTLEYEATDPILGLTATEIVTLTVNDTIAPVIVIDGYNVPSSYTILFEADNNFSIPNSQISDNSYCAGTIPPAELNNYVDISIDGSVLQQVPGNYNITYEATDKSGNTKYLILSVTVQDTVAPTAPTLIQYKLNNSGGATYSNTWTNNNVWIGNITSTDNGSGVDYYSYQLNCTGGWTNLAPGVTSFTITGEMDSNVCIKAYDYMPNESTITTSGLIRIDKTAPACATSGGNTAWTNVSRTILGTCTDTTGVVNSGCNGANPSHLFNAEINTTTAGPSSVGGSTTVVDQAGNSATCLANQTVRIDKTAPTCTSSGGNVAWTTTTRTLTGTCGDTGGSGCSGTTSFTNDFTTQINTTTATPGAYNFVDAAGNNGSGTCPSNQTVRIDTSAPTVAFNPNTNTTCAASHNVIATISDSYSGVAASPKYLWSVSTTAPADGSFVSTFTNGNTITGSSLSGVHYLWILGYDNVGYPVKNRSSSFAFPGANTVVFGTNGNTTYAKSHSTTVTATVDPCSGASITTLKYLWSTSATAPADGSFVSTFTNGDIVTGSGYTGDYYLWIYVQDSLGTIVKYPSSIFRFDNTAPTCSVAGGSATWTNGSRTVTGTCSDTGGSGCVGNISITYSSQISTATAGAAGDGVGGSVADNAGNTTACAANQEVRIDKTAPTCSVSGGSGSWTNGSRTITGSCSDTGGSGCAGNISTTYSSQISTATAGAVNDGVGGSVSDNAGNSVGCAANQEVRIDKTAPSISFSSNGNTNWSTTGHCTTPSYSDSGGSGIGSALYVWSSSTGSTPSYDMPNNTSRCYNLSTNTIKLIAQVCDGVGNCTKNWTSGVFYVDPATPTCVSNGGTTTWTTGTRTITGSCSSVGISGCGSTPSRLYSGTTNTDSGNPNGSVCSVAGLCSATCPSTQSIRIDNTAPTITSISFTYQTTTSCNIIWGTATDAHSGLHATPYSINNGSTYTSTKPTSGTKLQVIRIRDAMGNYMTRNITC